MKNLLRAAAAVSALALTAPALAQQSTQQQPPGTRLGFGAGITSSAASASSHTPDIGTLFFVPINVVPNLRIEPFLGWARSDLDPAPAAAGPFDLSPASGKSSDFTLGVGAFFVQPLAAQVQVYVGGRLGGQWQSFNDNLGEKVERRNTLLAAALGGEYMPVPRVAFGGELQLAFLSYGDSKWTRPNGVVVEGAGGSGSATQATLFARFYLF